VLAALLAVQPVAAAIAEAATPVTYQGGPMGTATATQDKPQSKLWRHDGSWWALMNGQVDKNVFIHRLTANHTWQQTGTEVDTKKSYGDVLADGDTLYVLSRRPADGKTALIRFTYDDATDSYQKSSGYPVVVITVPTESATIAKDSTGVLWATYTAPDSDGLSKVWVTHSTGSSDKTWVTPFELPVADTTVSADDIAAVVALDGKIGVMWSNQVSDTFRFVTHEDGAAPDQWGTLETALAGLSMADDHINLKKATDGRLFAAIKTGKTGLLSPLIMLLVRETDGTWSNYIHSTKGDGMTRPIVLLDETHRRVFLFAATAEGTGAQTYYKTTSMDAPGFGPGRGEPFVSWPGTTLLNATSTKQPVDPASGVVVLNGDRDDPRLYYHAELPLTPETTIDQGPSDPTSSTSASFEFSSDDAGASFECRLDDAVDFTACSSPQDYLDLAPGDRSLEVRAVDTAGVRDPTPATYSWTIDTDAPNTAVDQGPADPTSSTSASFEFFSDDPGAGFECKLDDAPDFSACGSPQDYQDLAPGSHGFEVRAVDQAGNPDPSPASYSWTIDTTPPETAIDQAPPDPSDSSSASFQFSSDDAGASFECKLDDALEFTACSSPQDYQDLPPGGHTFEVRALDQAGVRDPSPATHSWTIDTTAPGTTIDQAPADPTNSTSASFEFSSNDVGASFECKLDGALEFTACSSPQDYQDLAGGAHSFEVRAVDRAGNRDQSPASHAWTIDTTAPETTIDQAPPDPSGSTSASFQFSSGDLGASFECKLDDAAGFTACSSPQDYQDLAGGPHSFAVRAVDQAGNRDQSPATHSWTIELPHDPVIAAAGDVACNSSTSTAEKCRQLATSDLLVGMDPLDAVLGIGDLQQMCGELENYQAFYDPTWGRVKGKTYPVPGHHDYDQTGCLAGNTTGAPGYFNYFGDAATPLQPGCRVSCRGYYSFDLGDWHIVALNSNCAKAGGCDEGSPQETWLRSDLAATTKSCILAYAHHPRYASKSGASLNIHPLWAALYDGGADFLLASHAKVYERFARLGRGAPDSPEPTLDPNGMREIIVGTGGQSHQSFGTIRTGSEVRNAVTFGVLQLVLHPGSYDWEFLPEAGKTFTDSGTDTCQGAPRPGDTEPPTTPTDLSATPAGPHEVDLSWTAATDNIGVASYGVYRDGVLIGTASSTTFSDQTAVPDTTYEYAVDAVDAEGNRSALSAPATATTPSTSTAFRSSSFVSSSTTITSLTVPAPAGITAGDVMVASVDVRALPTITPPPGWTLIRADTNGTAMTMATYYRVAELAEPPSYTWGFSLKKAAAAGIVAYSGVDTVTPIDASDGSVSTSSTSITTPSITTTVPEARLVGFFGLATNTTVTPPTGMIERGDVASTYGTDVALEGADEVQSAAGATGPRTATAASTARNIGHLVALRPAP
jgi:hypothetical protein